MKRTDGKIAIVFLAAAGLVVGSMAFMYAMGHMALTGSHTLAAHRLTLQHLDEFPSTVQDAEAGQQAYLLTGQNVYLERHRSAIAEVHARCDTLRRLVSQGELPPDPVARVIHLTDQKLAELERTIRLQRDRGPEAALDIVRSGQGRQIMDQIGAEVAALKSQEERHFQQAGRQLEWATTLRTGAFILLALANLAFFAWAYHRITREVARRQAAALETGRQQQLLAAIVQSSDDAIISKDLAGTVLTWNDGARRMLGYDDSQIVGQPITVLLPPERVSEEEQILQQLRRGERMDHYETVRLSKDGRPIDVSVTISPLKDDNGRVVGASTIIRDVSERKQAEAALKKMNEQLEERVRERTTLLQETVEELRRSNEDLEHFAYISSHDLQEPLRMVAMYVGLLAHRYRDKLDASAVAYIDYAVEGAVRMSNLIKALREYSRINIGPRKLQPTDSAQVLGEALKNLHLRIEEAQARLVIDSLPTVPADPAQLSLVFQNLIDNAIKFRKDDEPPVIHVAAERRDGQWLFCVQDNGIGVDPQYQEQIFVAFKRLHADRARYPGTGIGLAIVKRIVERHGGQICVDTQPGNGFGVYFTLPVLNATKLRSDPITTEASGQN